LKKPTGSVRFRFYKPETEKIESNRIKPKQKKARKKLSQTGKTEPNRFELVFVLKNQIEPNPVGLNRFRFKKKLIWLYFFNKNRTKLKIITPTI
jgi:hypothetical protein